MNQGKHGFLVNSTKSHWKSTLQGFLLLLLAGCSTTQWSERRVFLDSTLHKDSAPDWVTSTRVREEKGGVIHLRALHGVRGNERVNGCFDLARLDAREVILSEIAADIKGRLDEAQQSLSESAELVLGKSRSEKFEGKMNGMKFTDEYFERYRIAEQERIDCYVLAELSVSDYQSLKRSILDQVTAADPRIKEAILAQQIHFFDEGRKTEVSKEGGKQKVSSDQGGSAAN